MEELRDKTLKGFSWVFAVQVIIQAVTFLTWIVLARILAPGDFGIIAMVLVFTRFLQIFRNMGLSESIIQANTITKTTLSNVFTFQICIAALIGLFLWISRTQIASFYNESLLATTIIGYFALDFFIGSFSLVPTALLYRKLQFKTIYLIELVSVVFSATLSIFLAAFGYGFMALVFKVLCFTVLQSTLFLLFSTWGNFDKSSSSKFLDHLKFGLPLMGSQLLNFAARNLDDLLIGKEFGKNALGIYNRSYAIMLFPLASLTNSISTVIFPVFSILQQENTAVNFHYLKVSRIIALISFPMMVVIFVLTSDLISVVLGPNWLEMIPIVRILSLLGMLQSISAINGSVFQALSKTKLLFKINLVTTSFVVISILFGVYGFGNILAVSYCYFFTSFIIAFPVWHLLGKLLNLSLMDILRNLFKIFLCALVFGSFLMLLDFFDFSPPSLFSLALKIVVALGFYIFLVHIIKEKAFMEVKEIIKEKTHSFRAKKIH